MIQSALKVSSTENISKRMELEFFRNWLVVSRKTPNEIFKSLELDNAGSTLFTNPFLDTWIQYMTAFNKLKPRDKTDMIETFLRYFGEGNLLQMIKTGKKIPKTEKVALDMERALLLYQITAKKNKDTTKSTESSAYSYGKDDYGHDDYSHDDYGYDAYAYEHDDYKSSDYKVDDYEHKGYGGGYSYGYKTYGSDCDDYSDDDYDKGNDYYGHGNDYYSYDKGYGYGYGYYPDTTRRTMVDMAVDTTQTTTRRMATATTTPTTLVTATSTAIATGNQATLALSLPHRVLVLMVARRSLQL
ncbi:hypothetical protein PC110_g19814 [Phytophthora cactorum]|uniref:RxLR effector PexRD54 WY domain-containing protein n=4 Tax=Phytophthora cactorum TaxID=29920 RepID=A0A329RHB2_9STRA|nr:hypothetical protein PC110_g19814 [Phytophthora cactorum]